MDTGLVEDIDYSGLPLECCKDSMRLYIENGYNPGSGMYAVLVGDLWEASGRLDEKHWENLKDTMRWIFNEPPSYIWGNRQRVDNWVADGGHNGRKQTYTKA